MYRQRFSLLIPDLGITPAQAAVATDAVLTAYHAIFRRAEVKPDETVFLFGLGGLGFNALQIVHKAIGARVIVSDIRQECLDEAANLGVPKEDIVPVGKSVQEFVAENGLQGKIDMTLDFVGEKQTFEDAQHIGQCFSKKLLPHHHKQYIDQMVTPCSANRREVGVCWDSSSRQHRSHEDGHPQKAQYYFLVRRSERGLGGSAPSDVQESDYTSGRGGPAGKISASTSGSLRR